MEERKGLRFEGGFSLELKKSVVGVVLGQEGEKSLSGRTEGHAIIDKVLNLILISQLQLFVVKISIF